MSHEDARVIPLRGRAEIVDRLELSAASRALLVATRLPSSRDVLPGEAAPGLEIQTASKRARSARSRNDST